MNALVQKDIRDAIRWLPLGLFVLTFFLVMQFRAENFYSRLSSQLLFPTWVSSTCFAVLLGFITFLPDEREGARAFLIHRGIPVKRIFWSRVLVGLSVYFAAMLLPLACTAIYLAWIGPQHAPVSPVQVIPSALAVIYCSANYFASLMVACSKSRWYGTRLLPLCVSVLVGAAPGSILVDVNITPFVLMTSLGTLGLIVLIVASKYSFLFLARELGPSNRVTKSGAFVVALLSASVIAFSGVMAIPFNFGNNIIRNNARVYCAADGRPWIAIMSFSPVDGLELRNRTPITAEPTLPSESVSKFEARKKDALDHAELGLNNLRDFRGSWFDFSENRTDLGSSFFTRNGYLYEYIRQHGRSLRLVAVIGPNGVTGPDEAPGRSFDSPIKLLVHQTLRPSTRDESLFFVTKAGVFKYSLKKKSVDHIVDQKVDGTGDWSIVLADPSPEQRQIIALRNGEEAHIWKRVWNATPSEAAPAVEDLGIISLPPTSSGHDHRLFFKDKSNWTLVTNHYGQRTIIRCDVTRVTDDQRQSYSFKVPDNIVEATRVHEWQSYWAAISLPAGFMSFVISVSQAMRDESLGSPHLMLVLINALLAATITFLVASRRGIVGTKRIYWTIVGLFAGFGTALAIIAIYAKPILERCSGCNGFRRVEREHCEHCGADWEPPRAEGIEILDASDSIPSSPTAIPA